MAKARKTVKKAARTKKPAAATKAAASGASASKKRAATAKRTPASKKAVSKKVARPETKARRSAADSKVLRVEADASAARPKKVSSGLTPRDLEFFRDLLVDKRREILGDMSTMRDEASSANGGDLSSMPLHMADLGTDNFERELTLGLMQGERTLVREIDAAIARIDSGDFGICAATGKPIGKARLKAQPWAKFCYEYMLQQERGRRYGF